MVENLSSIGLVKPYRSVLLPRSQPPTTLGLVVAVVGGDRFTPPQFYGHCLSERGHHPVGEGGDDTSYERNGLSEARARVLWSRLRDFVTLKTLFRLGFRSE